MPFTSANVQKLAALLFIAGTASLQAAEAVRLPAKGNACKQLPADQESAAWRCPGPSGYSFTFEDHVMRSGVSFGMGGKDNSVGSEDLAWSPAGDGISSRVEWQLVNGRPVAAIIGRWRRADDAVPPTVVEELLVVKVMPAGVCALGIVGALSPDALAFARSIAETKALTFRCGIDKPVLRTNLVQDSVKNLDDRFSSEEVLSHNGSLMELSHAGGGTIEIRYKEPRSGLGVAPGTLLFRGQEHDGKLKGDAFVFKDGCPPADYEVSGRRQEGVLFLEGAAPRRGRECTIVGGSKTSKHAHLAFEHEPIIEASASQVRQERPFIAQCSQCVGASIKAIEGVGTKHGYVEGEVTKDDVLDYCGNWASGSDRMDTCLKENSIDIGKVQRADANCPALTVQPSSAGRYKFFRMGEDYGGSAPTWINLANGQVECGARACNSASATAHFTLLCPGAIPGWTGRRNPFQ